MKFTSLLCPYFLDLVGREDEFLLAKLKWATYLYFFFFSEQLYYGDCRIIRLCCFPQNFLPTTNVIFRIVKEKPPQF